MTHAQQQKTIIEVATLLAQNGHHVTVGPGCIRRIDDQPFEVDWKPDARIGSSIGWLGNPPYTFPIGGWRIGAGEPYTFCDDVDAGSLVDAIEHSLRDRAERAS